MRILLLAALLAATVAAAEPIPWPMPLDGGNGVVDLSIPSPAGAKGRVVVRDGHFVLTDSGERIRFLGVALCAETAFPEPEVGAALARRLARLGVNCVRIHYIDGGGGGRFGRHSIWDPAFPREPRLDPAQMERFDRLVSELKKRGIYVNLNLKVARAFGEADGLPPGYCGEGDPKRITKGVDLVDPRLIALQKDYARDLLSHVNPHTGLSYAEDPAVMVVELNNENSLVNPNRPIDDAAGWPEGPEAALRKAWNRFLATRYPNQGALASAWAGTGDLGAALSLDSTWELERNMGATGSLSQDGARWAFRIEHSRGVPWHVQATCPIADLPTGTRATLQLRLRADRRRPVTVRCEMGVSPWTNRGLDATVPIGPEWREIRLPFTVAPGGAPIRLVVRLGTHTGLVEMDGVSLLSGHAPPDLPPEGALAAGSLAVPVAAQGGQRDDWLRFLVAVETDYARDMYAFVRSLGVKAPIVCGQASWGAWTGVHREEASDYIDDHQYWDHPGRGFRDASLLVHGRALVDEMTDAGPLADLARLRVAGRPFSVSEFNHCAPNPHRAEALPIVSVVAALQDWDALVLHEYGWPPAPLAMIWQPFETGSDPALMAFLPAAALAFRDGAVGRLTAESWRAVDPTFTPGASGRPADTAWTSAEAGARLLTTRLGLDLGHPRPPWLAGPGWEAPGMATVGIPGCRQGIFTCLSARVAILAGHLGDTLSSLGPVTLNVGPCTRNFGAVAVAALDGQPLEISRRLLVTAMAGSSNTGMQRKPDGTGFAQTEDWGTAPVLVEPLTGTLDLPLGEGLCAWALDPGGAVLAPAVLERTASGARLNLRAEDRSVWYLIAEKP